jgi:hypothetical protein
MKIIDGSLPIYKANFHTHTTCSDGMKSPAEAMSLYRAMGYDILSLTDHRTVTHVDHAPEGLLVIPGIELDTTNPQTVHILGIGVTDGVTDGYTQQSTPQEMIDTIRRHGGEAILAHPAWSLNDPHLMAGLRGLCGAEVYNSVSDVPYNAARADSSSLLDVTGAMGQRLNFFANEDTHFYGAELGRSATMVQCAALTEEDVLDALRQGHFYASQGPRFEEITLEEGCLKIRCTPVKMMIFYSDVPWMPDRTTVGDGLTEGAWQAEVGKESFIRCQIIDAQGKSAWTSPFAVK